MKGNHKYCVLCKNQDIESEVAAKYFLKKGKNQAYSGWIYVCEDCAENIPFEVIYLKRKKKIEIDNNCNHKYIKKNLVTIADDRGGHDILRCEFCRHEKLRYGIGGLI